jgi:hypothetical protein
MSLLAYCDSTEGLLTLATLIDFSTLAACRSRSSTLLLKDLICTKPYGGTSDPNWQSGKPENAPPPCAARTAR